MVRPSPAAAQASSEPRSQARATSIAAAAGAGIIWPIWNLDVGPGQGLGAIDRPLLFVEDEGVSVLSILKLLLTVWGAIVASRTLRQLLNRRVFPRTDFDSGATTAINTMVHYPCLVVGVVVGLRFVGVGLSSLAIFAGVLGIGIGFGLRNITENFISGLIILAERPIKIGDYIAKYKMPGYRIDCVFCPEVKETAEHLFYSYLSHYLW